ncbi:MAG TPA: hypothetical protein VFR86_20800 [Burkholderiaceae bacterium]|nr:hypothetical protein [Burkholderiaceae bacterium]
MSRNERQGWIAAIVFAAWVAGCASTPVERKDAMSGSLIELRDSMVEMQGQIGQTLASLDGLISAPPERLRDANQSGAAAARALDTTIADLQVLTQTVAPSE